VEAFRAARSRRGDNPDRRPEAGPKIAAYGKIALLGVASRPEELPDDLRRESSDIDFVPARHPDVSIS